MAKRKKPPPPSPPEDEPLIRVNMYCPQSLEGWLQQNWQARKAELETEYGPGASRDYSMSKHLVGIVHQAKVSTEAEA